MDKKDIYEHLAKIYLDASLQGSNRVSKRDRLKKPLIIGGIAIAVLAVALAAVLAASSRQPKNQQLALVLCPDIMRINFHFDPAKKESINVRLNSLDMGKYKAVEFSAKRQNYGDTVSLRLDFSNNFKEQAHVYLRDIPTSWKPYRFSLADFKGISDWSSMQEMIFSVEEWNSREKNGAVFIDNVRFVR